MDLFGVIRRLILVHGFASLPLPLCARQIAPYCHHAPLGEQ